MQLIGNRFPALQESRTLARSLKLGAINFILRCCWAGLRKSNPRFPGVGALVSSRPALSFMQEYKVTQRTLDHCGLRNADGFEVAKPVGTGKLDGIVPVGFDLVAGLADKLGGS